MSLQIWLPLNGDINNIGIDGTITTSALGTVSYTNEGKIGKAFISGGTTQVTNGVSLNSNLLDILGTQASVSVWVKPLGNHYHYNGTIVSSGNWNYECWAFGVSQDNTKVDVLSGKYNRYINCAVPVNEWTHLVSVYDNGTSKVYKNGEYVGELTGLPAFDSNATNTCVGRETYASGYFGFNGYINDVRIYDHCLTLKEIKEIYKTLVLHYKLDNASFGQKNLIPDSVYDSDPWKSAILETLDLDGKAAKRVSHNTLYTKTSNGTTELFPGMTYDADTQYTISLDWRDDYRTDNKVSSMYLRFHHSDDSVTSINSGDLRDKHYWTHRTLTSTAGKTVTKITTTYGNGGSIYIANLKLEKGAVDTGYAPYDDIPIYDCSGYCRDGTITGSLSVSNDTPRYNNSTKLSDSASSIGIGNLATYLPEKVFTFNIWFKKVTGEWSTKAWETILGGPSSGFELEAKLSSTTKAYIHPYSWGGGSTSNPNGYSIEYALDEWHMLTMVRTTSDSKFYLDGELKVTGTAGSLPSGNYFLGAWQTAIKQNYRGYLSDARIYATAFTVDDILELYNSPASADRDGNLYVREVVEE